MSAQGGSSGGTPAVTSSYSQGSLSKDSKDASDHSSDKAKNELTASKGEKEKSKGVMRLFADTLSIGSGKIVDTFSSGPQVHIEKFLSLSSKNSHIIFFAVH